MLRLLINTSLVRNNQDSGIHCAIFCMFNNKTLGTLANYTFLESLWSDEQEDGLLFNLIGVS